MMHEGLCGKSMRGGERELDNFLERTKIRIKIKKSEKFNQILD
jgi:hypothetical protein